MGKQYIHIEHRLANNGKETAVKQLSFDVWFIVIESLRRTITDSK